VGGARRLHGNGQRRCRNVTVLVEARKNGSLIASTHTISALVGAAMINRIIEFSMKNRWLILVFMQCWRFGDTGAVAHAIDAIPDLSETR